MRGKLDPAFHPPAAVAPVRLRAPNGVDSASLSGKLDSGADVCAVPEHLVLELGLPPVRRVRAAGFGGVLEEMTAYRIDVEVAGKVARRVEALTTRRPYAIIGRNVLSGFVFMLDGPGGSWELRAPRKRAR